MKIMQKILDSVIVNQQNVNDNTFMENYIFFVNLFYKFFLYFAFLFCMKFLFHLKISN